MNQKKELLQVKKAIADLENLKEIQCGKGTWNCNPYMHGMANGLILAASCFTEQKEVMFLDAPDAWLDG